MTSEDCEKILGEMSLMCPLKSAAPRRRYLRLDDGSSYPVSERAEGEQVGIF